MAHAEHAKKSDRTYGISRSSIIDLFVFDDKNRHTPRCLSGLRTEPGIITTLYASFFLGSNLSSATICTIAWINSIPLHWQNYRCQLIEIRIPLFPLFIECPPVRPCECGCIHEDPLLPYPVCCHLQMDGATVDAWLYFPGIKSFSSIPKTIAPTVKMETSQCQHLRQTRRLLMTEVTPPRRPPHLLPF
ncbi:uncharacterized protein LOC124338050 [Daphnia pulicaria]|uniref:uncharacterized protein LOC124338050 n=1 Tax=Daphnia pulicaria TaxID=35523 RepID=UPI001EE9B306|nr:uncharacterized protein LOC124338050 [Daphnia pulicaria]